MTRSSSLVRTLAIAALAAGSMAVTCGPGGPDIPEPEFCDQGSTGSLDAIELGPAGDGPFVPFQDGDRVSLVFGSQGGTMIGVRLQARGADVPACMQQHTRAETAAGVTSAEVVGPVATHPESDGSRATSSMLMIFNFDAEPSEGDVITLRATVGDMEVAHTVEIGPL